MRAFLVLCLVAVASADKLGYNYQPVAHSDSGLSFAPGSDASHGGGGVASHGSVGAPSLNSAPSYDSGRNSYDSGISSYDAQGSNGSPSLGAQGELQKEFITFSADEEEFNDPEATNQFANAVKQGLRVVFIKGPDNNGLEDAALALAKQAANQQTAIYVLNKQTDLSDLANKLNAVSDNSNNKPEVHFVKYRSAEDADNAQRAIQGQYDALGGQSQNINGGVAPVLNFASQAPLAARSASAPGASYLPSSVFRRFRA
ncbi:uncharacterized protein LOC106081816 [Stomoxys calcitrans]|uniref:DUF243 domain-containing protein n=1 Tax=Stomoxys calcitrans TaxID=35570 RepID=A0A1I8PYL8_STOCA|nr:uncharacterized protein LOC106081816 [Stomoxys calcitrans]